MPWKADPYDLHQLDLPHALPSDLFAVGFGQWEHQQEVGEWMGEVRVHILPALSCRTVGWDQQVPTPKRLKSTACPSASPQL